MTGIPGLLLTGGLVVDGTGASPPSPGDVLLRDGRIEAILDRPGSRTPGEPGPGAGALRRLDCTGTLVSPGFIDIHAHSDLTWLSTPDCLSRVTQGITTEVGGNCGMSPAPRDRDDPGFRPAISVIDQDPDAPLGFAGFGEYLDVLAAHQAAVNLVPLVGHGSARQTALFRAPGDDPGEAVAALVREALAGGAWGTSLGLMYAPGEAAGPDELTAVARQTAAAGALLTAHMRSYAAETVAASVRELCLLAARTGVRLELSHLRAIRADSMAVIEDCLGLLDAAGPRVTADAYPYTAGQTTLLQLLPSADRQHGVTRFLARLPAGRARYAAGIAANGAGPQDIVVVRVRAPRDAPAVGRTLADYARELGQPWAELAVDLLRRSEGYVDVVVFGSKLDEQRRILAHDKVMIGSDGFSLSADYPAAVHPRAFGAFPKALRLLVDAGLPWERAIAKATSEPAATLGLTGRGELRPGARADITVIDPAGLADQATYEAPLRPAAGVRHVLVGGIPVLEDGRPTGRRPGHVLLRT
jgi:N-acyl-D-aspartate/D-glutamate deacylase